MHSPSTPTARRRALRTLLVAVSVLGLLAAVGGTIGTAAALAVSGMVAVVGGFVALLGGRADDAARRGRRGAVVVLALGGAGAFLGGTAFAAPPPAAGGAERDVPAAVATTPPADAGPSALAALDGLPVRAAAPADGFRRSAFGPRWADLDDDGCSTVDDLARRDLVDRAVLGCRVIAGALRDPYSGRTVWFGRGDDASAALRIDRVVTPAAAWRSGAAALPRARRVALANDPLNLFVVEAASVRGKGDRTAAGWLPERAAFRCTYVAHQIAVKQAYRLSVTVAERDAMRVVLAACPDRALPGPALAD